MHPPAPSSRTLTGNERRIADICGENTMPRHEAGNMSAPDLRGRFPCGLGSAARNLCASLRRRADAARRERSVSPRHLPSPWRRISWQTSPVGEDRGRRDGVRVGHAALRAAVSPSFHGIGLSISWNASTPARRGRVGPGDLGFGRSMQDCCGAALDGFGPTQLQRGFFCFQNSECHPSHPFHRVRT